MDRLNNDSEGRVFRVVTLYVTVGRANPKPLLSVNDDDPDIESKIMAEKVSCINKCKASASAEPIFYLGEHEREDPDKDKKSVDVDKKSLTLIH